MNYTLEKPEIEGFYWIWDQFENIKTIGYIYKENNKLFISYVGEDDLEYKSFGALAFAGPIPEPIMEDKILVPKF